MDKKKTAELDDKDVVFVDEPWTDEERKKFSDFLKARKLRQQTRRQVWKFTTRTRRHYAQQHIAASGGAVLRRTGK